MPRQLSSNNGAAKVTLSGLGLAVVVVLLAGAIQSMSLTGIMIVIVLLSLACVALVALIREGLRSYDLSYDDTNLYLTHRREWIVVPFHAITRVKKEDGQMIAGGRPVYQFTIYYRDEHDQRQEVNFWKSLEDGSVEDFQYKVKKIKEG